MLISEQLRLRQPSDPRCTVCPASTDEAADLANLAVLASDGLVFETWEALREGTETAMDVGRRRAAGKTGAFSYRNADVALQKRKVIAAMFSYPLDPPSSPADIQQAPATMRPILALEARAVPSWYINILATYPEARGQGAATALLRFAEERAVEANLDRLSLIVSEENPARQFYDGVGFQEVARQPQASAYGEPGASHWILMIKDIL